MPLPSFASVTSRDINSIAFQVLELEILIIGGRGGRSSVFVVDEFLGGFVARGLVEGETLVERAKGRDEREVDDDAPNSVEFTDVAVGLDDVSVDGEDDDGHEAAPWAIQIDLRLSSYLLVDDNGARSVGCLGLVLIALSRCSMRWAAVTMSHTSDPTSGLGEDLTLCCEGTGRGSA